MSAKVTLLTYTPSPEKTIAAAAKLCYSATDVSSIYNNITDEAASEFVEMLAGLGHQSPIEHVTFTFGIEGISRACSHQLVRHRIASYSQQSQRYVDGNKFDFVTPPSVKACKEANEEYNKILNTQAKAYSKIRDALMVKSIKEFLKDDCKDKTNNEILNNFKNNNKKQFGVFQKLANEDARFILPNACCTKIICTFNARSLQNFFTHRCCNRAQWEIRDVATQMLVKCIEVAPTLFKTAGPPCLRGNCPEGKMTCGEMHNVKMYYDNLRQNKTQK